MEALNNIKNLLLELQSFDDTATFCKLQNEVGNLIGEPGIVIGITPFLNINDHFVFSAIHNTNSVFLKNLSTDEERSVVSEGLKRHFDTNKEPLVISHFTDDTLLSYSFLKHLQAQGWTGIIICPLRNYNELIGVLEIVTDKPCCLDRQILNKIDTALPLFELALNRSWANLDARIDKVIKEQFTAIQPSVEWRFTEAALNYLSRDEQDEDTKMETILFDHVYPLYGAIDIRNSSTERNKAIQADMLEQLDMAAAIILKAQEHSRMPLLDEINFKIRKYRHSVSNIILSDDEVAINQFLRKEVVQLFEHLRGIIPTLEPHIAAYFSDTTSQVDMLYRHRKEFDESITFINKTIARFIDREQQAAQQIYPHYFERFVTDGVDFNIYIGQSISPRITFSDFYLRNLKIWQLSTLAKAAMLSEQLRNQMAIPLQTTQLILSHGFPISISFRPAERKFDVDGAYNIRYEIVKKRIDKVHIRNSNERLTQPGKIGIVYSQQREAEEYLEYIEYLHDQGVLSGETEHFELEELQGIGGLRALRVSVNVSSPTVLCTRAEVQASKG